MKRARSLFAGMLLLVSAALAVADEYTDAAARFKNAGQSSAFFNNCYGYAVFPSVGKGGLIVGGARGTGHVFVKGAYVGDAVMTELSVGFQAGGEAYSQVIFFEDQRAFDEFTKGNFEFGADASAVAITAAAGAGANTAGGATANASGGQNDAKTAGKYYKGFAVFTIVKGGAMVSASLAGQKYQYSKKGG
jgi:lipid-binding SYLF domain-containing protein